MELTRRDALAALAAAGAGSFVGCSALSASSDETATPESSEVADGTDTPGDATEGGPSIDAHESATLIAVAAVVYPTDLDGIEAFVRTYVDGRIRDDTYARGVTEAVGALDEYTTELHDDRYADLSRETRRAALDHMSVDVADPDPDGTAAQRVRYYLVNELLYALYTSPTGAELAGLENPPGHPGGIRSYREGPSG